jgi:chaperonin GroES
MHLTPDNKFKKLIIIGDRVLIRPTRPHEKTETGLYLPPGVQEKERVQQGYVIKIGPGYALPMPPEDEPWKTHEEQVRYLAPAGPGGRPGDLPAKRGNRGHL